MPEPVVASERFPRVAVGAAVGFVLVAVGLAIWATLPTGGVRIDSSSPVAVGPLADAGGVAETNVAGPGSAGDAVGAASAASTPPGVVVDVEGAVVDPGLHVLPAGSRVGDAIAAAGGFSASVDVAAATSVLNLAQKLVDGAQLRVPALGDQPVADLQVAADTPAGAGPPGLVDINHASAEALDTLPGIGPVTAAKIIDARTQAPFATVDELGSRGVVGSSTLEKIRALVTVTP